MKMKHLILVITFFVLGYPVFAQNKSITVKGQRCYLNNEDIYLAKNGDFFCKNFIESHSTSLYESKAESMSPKFSNITPRK
jgi:hypothetical protein